MRFEETQPEFQPKIAELRKQKPGLTQLALSKIVGVTETTIANWERARNKRFSEKLRKLSLLCQTLNCSLGDLVSQGLKCLREKEDLTQLAVADTIGVTTTTIADWEHKRKNIEFWEQILRLCIALDCESPQDLIEIKTMEKGMGASNQATDISPVPNSLELTS